MSGFYPKNFLEIGAREVLQGHRAQQEREVRAQREGDARARHAARRKARLQAQRQARRNWQKKQKPPLERARERALFRERYARASSDINDRQRILNRWKKMRERTRPDMTGGRREEEETFCPICNRTNPIRCPAPNCGRTFSNQAALHNHWIAFHGGQ